MSKKITKCKICHTDVAVSAKTCPHCGAKNKKSIIKKWWFWLILVFVFISLVTVAESENVQPSTENTASSVSENRNKETTETPNTTVTETEAQEETIIEEITPAQIYSIIGENDEMPFVLSDKALLFMNEHKNFFPGKSDIKGAISDFVDPEITYPHLTKNISKYGDKLVSLYGTVIDISEDEEIPLTYIHLLDYDNNSYILYYLGILDNVFENTEVWVYALPLDLTTFENMQAQYTEAVICAASYVETMY